MSASTPGSGSVTLRRADDLAGALEVRSAPPSAFRADALHPERWAAASAASSAAYMVRMVSPSDCFQRHRHRAFAHGASNHDASGGGVTIVKLQVLAERKFDTAGMQGSPSRGLHTVGAQGMPVEHAAGIRRIGLGERSGARRRRGRADDQRDRTSRRSLESFHVGRHLHLDHHVGLLQAGSPFLILSTRPCPRRPRRSRCTGRSGGAVAEQMKNCGWPSSGRPARHADAAALERLCVNSALRFGNFEPPVPLPFWPSPVCAMKPAITRWNGTPS